MSLAGQERIRGKPGKSPSAAHLPVTRPDRRSKASACDLTPLNPEIVGGHMRPKAVTDLTSPRLSTSTYGNDESAPMTADARHVFTNHDDQTVAVRRPAPLRRKVAKSGWIDR